MPENNEQEGLGAPQDTAGEGDKRSENRYKDLADKVAEAHKEKAEIQAKADKEKAELEAKLKEAEFTANFAGLQGKYPNAKEFEAEIKEKASKGYTLEDATLSTLASKGKLISPEVQRQEVVNQAIGGSADINVNNAKGDDPTFGGDSGKMREELVRLEKTGDVGLKF